MDDFSLTGLAPNFSEIILSKSIINIFSTDYDQRLMNECISNHDDIFYLRAGNKIFAWSRSGAEYDGPNGFTPTQVSMDDYPQVIAKVVQQSILAYFKKMREEKGSERIFKERHSSNYFFRIEKLDESYSISNLSFVPYFYFSVGYLRINNKTHLYLSCWRDYKRRFEVEESVIQSEGIDTSRWDRRNDILVGSPRNVKEYISSVRGDLQLKKIQSEINNKIVEFTHIKKSLSFIDRKREDIKIVDNVKILQISHLGIPNDCFKDFHISRPQHYFYNNGTSNGRLDQMVSDLKPFSYEVMGSRKFSVVAFVPSAHAGTCDDFIGKIKSRLSQVFHLNDIDIIQMSVSQNRDDHINLISKFDHQQFDLAFTFLNLADKNQALLSSDYNRIKAKLLGKGVPSQNLLMETVRGANQYSLNNIVLNIYSKLGGTPWVIEKDQKSTLELIVGIGSSLDQDNDRTIGFASVFDHHGTYILGGCSPLSNMQNYAERLREHLIGVVAEAIQIQGVEPNSTIRLIFHLFKDASKNYEIKAILETIESFAEYKIEYSLVHICYQHPFRLYQGEGKDIVRRGTYVQISEKWALLNMGVKRSTPLLIKLDSRSTYADLYDLCKQVLYFSHLSHKSFSPGNEPVTTKYSTELARKTNDLMTVPYWDVDMIEKLKDRVWFI